MADRTDDARLATEVAIRPSWWIAAAITILTLAALTTGSRIYRLQRSGRCHLDGGPVEPAYQVSVTDRADRRHEFCSISCAERWISLQRSGIVASIEVTDELSHQPIPAHQAYYVQSMVIVSPLTGERRHAFRSRAAAQKHIDQFSGILLEGPNKPFQRVLTQTDD